MVDFRGCAYGARAGIACAAHQQFVADGLFLTTGPILLTRHIAEAPRLSM